MLIFTGRHRFLIATAHVGVNCRRLIEGYVNPPDKISMIKYLLDITQPTNVAKQFLVVMAVSLVFLLFVDTFHLTYSAEFILGHINCASRTQSLHEGSLKYMCRSGEYTWFGRGVGRYVYCPFFSVSVSSVSLLARFYIPYKISHHSSSSLRYNCKLKLFKCFCSRSPNP